MNSTLRKIADKITAIIDNGSRHSNGTPDITSFEPSNSTSCSTALLDNDQPSGDIQYYSCPYFTKMHIEITSLCNLKCSHCSRSFAEYPSKNKVMSVSLFKNIVDQISSRIGLLQMQGFGEPTMHPQFVDLLEYAVASRKFNSVMITTNLLFKSADDFDLYFRKGLSSLIVSVDSIDPDNIAKIRQGSDLSKLLGNIKAVSAMYADRMALQTTVNRLNVAELDNIAALIKDCGIKSWILNSEQHISSKGESRIEFEKHGDLSLFPKELEKLSQIIKVKYGSKINIDTSLLYQHLTSRPRCTMPWEWIHINADGVVVPCCRYFDGNYSRLGDVREVGINQIWCSSQMQQFRNDMYYNQPVICKNCVHY